MPAPTPSVKPFGTTTLRNVRGDYTDDCGYLKDYGPRSMTVRVDNAGVAYTMIPAYAVDYDDMDADDIAKLRGDKNGDVWEPIDCACYNGRSLWLGHGFIPDDGEIERCGIAIREVTV
jgi:hypothetical protein